jgi:hypothetical protein
MQELIDSTVKFRFQHSRRSPASIGTILAYLDDVYKAVQHEKSYSGIHARLISHTINLLLEVYSNYLLENDILDSKFFMVFSVVLARIFNERRLQLVSEDEKELFQPVCVMILKIADSMTLDQANCNIIHIFFDKTFVLLLADGLKTFAENKVLYGTK